MEIDNIYIYGAVLVGLGATLIMDLWALILRSTFHTALPNYCLVGRWLCHMPGGTFVHANIAAAPKKVSECAVGWIFHYLTGVSYALIFVILLPGNWLERPSLIPALLFGMVTVFIPYFIMQPSFGLGIAAAKTSNPTQARLKSLMSHTSFGIGLYLSGVAYSFAIYTYA